MLKTRNNENTERKKRGTKKTRNEQWQTKTSDKQNESRGGGVQPLAHDAARRQVVGERANKLRSRGAAQANAVAVTHRQT
jgi:hypothetical protein